MLYRALPFGPNSKIQCMAQSPHPYQIKDPEEHRFASMAAEEFTKSCQTIVNDEQELQRAFESGYRKSPQDAVDAAMAREDSIARAAAERAYDDRNISDAAKLEVARAEAAADGKHLPEIPESPVVKRVSVANSDTVPGKRCKGVYGEPPCEGKTPKEYDYCDAHARLRPAGAPGSPQCVGATAKGPRCSRRAREGFKTCGLHKKAG